jgi:hypothetical protein
VRPPEGSKPDAPALRHPHPRPAAGGPSRRIHRLRAHGNTFLLRWHSRDGWLALGWEGAGDAGWPVLHPLTGDKQGLITGHVEIAGSGGDAGTEGAAVKNGSRPVDRHPQGVRALALAGTAQVKPLAWREPEKLTNVWTADSVLGTFSVGFLDGWYACLEDGDRWEWEPENDPRSYDGPYAAQAACQAHFDSRILSALATGPMSEPTYGIIDPDYARVFTIARCIAWAEGYALVMHGSFTRDLDLVAIPWTVGATDPEHLVKRITLALDDLSLLVKKPGAPSQATERPHGRLSWTLTFKAFGDPRFVDLSVVARSELHGPFGHLVGPVDLDESHWDIEAAPVDRPGYFSVPLFTKADPFALTQEQDQ